MRTKIGVMGSAAPDSARLDTGKALVEKAEQLAQAIAKHDVVLFTGATTGIVYVVGKTAHDAGCFHVGISPGSNELEHVDH
jgi:predicted Rossmann-fold nucleotide-binding protein